MKFAVVGCGRIGTRRINAIKKLGSEVVHIVDINEEHISKMARELGCDHSVDFHEAVKRDDVDCVIIATPNKFHAPIAVEALNNGKHVLCEKPLARNPEEARVMANAASKNGVFLKTGSNLRYFSNIQKAKKMFDERGIGDLLFIRGWIGHDILKWVGGRKGEPLPKSWFFDKDLMGGGTLLDNGVHILDLFRWFFGDFKECFGYVKTLDLPIETEDNGWGLFKTEDGKAAFLQASWTEWIGYMYMQIYGTDGYIYIDNRSNQSKTIYGDRAGAQEVFDYSTEPPRSYELELQDFIETVKKGKQPLPSGYDGMKVIEMVQGIYDSSKTGRIVKLP